MTAHALARAKTYVGVYAALMVATVVTVGVGALHLTIVAAVGVALAIAATKASLVAAYFMHLRWDKPFNAFVFLASFAFLALFIGFAMMDTGHYQPTMIPGFAPAMGN